MRIGIIGYGFVGQAVHSCMDQSRTVVVINDPAKGYGGDVLKDTKAVFVCLPTPMREDGTQDTKTLGEWLHKLSQYDGVIIIKSTVVPSVIGSLPVNGRIVMNPEFLNANSAVNDFFEQKLIVLGGHMNDCLEVRSIYEKNFILSGTPRYEYMSRMEAVQIKYMHNVYHAFKSLFWNYVYDVTGNHRKIADIYKKLRKDVVDNEFTRVCTDGKRGYGGACFTKDVAAWNAEFPHELTKFMISYNKSIRKEE